MDFDGPQKAGEGQVLVIEWFNEGSAGQKRRWRNRGEHPLTLAWARGQISDGMFAAGETYRWAYEVSHGRSGVDSTQALMASARCSAGYGWLQSAVDAGAFLARVDAAMPDRSRDIVRAFCGKGHKPADAVRASVILQRPQGVMDRLREAMEDLERSLTKTTGRRAA